MVLSFAVDKAALWEHDRGVLLRLPASDRAALTARERPRVLALPAHQRVRLLAFLDETGSRSRT